MTRNKDKTAIILKDNKQIFTENMENFKKHETTRLRKSIIFDN